MDKRYSSVSFYLMVFVLTLAVGLLMWVSVKGYSYCEGKARSMDNRRAVTSYLTTIINNYDYAGGVEIRDDGKMIVLKEYLQDGIYENRIYAKDGYLHEYYCPQSEPTLDSMAESLGKTNSMYAEVISDHLLKISTDEGVIFISFESAGVYDEK